MAKICAGSDPVVEGRATFAVPMDWAITPSGNRTESGQFVGWIGISADKASARRMRILLEPESAHASTGSSFCLGALVSKECFLSFRLRLRLDTLVEFANDTTALLSRPPSQDLVLPPGGFVPFLAARCAGVYLVVSLSMVLHRSPLWKVVP